MLRRPVPWPDGAKVAVAITFDMDADSLVHVQHPRDSITRVSTISMLRYGPEVALPRILDGYRRFGLKQTLFVPAWCIEHYPAAVEAMVRDGHEVGFHGYIHEAPNALARDEEHYWMQRGVAVIEARTGQRPRGNRSPLYNFSITPPSFSPARAGIWSTARPRCWSTMATSRASPTPSFVCSTMPRLLIGSATTRKRLVSQKNDWAQSCELLERVLDRVIAGARTEPSAARRPRAGHLS
jgi:Polysaccharide deacetylase